jgi:membrane-associated phospholipid phosphatase
MTSPIAPPTADLQLVRPSLGTKRARLLVNAAGLGVFIGVTAYVTVRWGLVVIMRDWLWVWILGFLLAISLTDLRRYGRGVILDWLPFVGIIVAYDLLRGMADPSVGEAHYVQQLDAERFLFGGTLPTQWLQDRLWDFPANGVIHVYDYALWALYNTHFVTTVLVAAVLWKVNRERFLRFRTMVAVLAFSAMLTFAAFPTLPPWLAFEQGHISEVPRLVQAVWHHTGMRGSGNIFEDGAEWANPVAAWPSLHAAYPMLLLLFFWSAAGRVVRALLVTYVLAMGFVLVYSGEHYFVDIIGGWIYGAAAFTMTTFAYRVVEQRRSLRSQFTGSFARSRPSPTGTL